jgi:murein endopeptidase
MDVKDFVKQKLDTTNTTVFDSGWVKTERIKKDAGSDEIVVSKQLFDAKQDGCPDELATWLQNGKVTIKQK